MSCYNGCSNDERTGALRYSLLAVPYRHGTLFGYGSYQITPDITASLQLNYGQSSERSEGGFRQTLSTIRPDNAYLDPVLAAQFGTLSNGFNAGNGDARHRGDAHPVAQPGNPESQQHARRQLFLQRAVQDGRRALQ